MLDKGTCNTCGRKIQETAHNKCMYCGEPLKADQRFTEEEIASINLRKSHTEEMNKVRNKPKQNTDDYSAFDWPYWL